MVLPLESPLDSVRHPGVAPTHDEFFAWPTARQAELVFEELFVKRTPLSEARRGVITVLHAARVRVRLTLTLALALAQALALALALALILSLSLSLTLGAAQAGSGGAVAASARGAATAPARCAARVVCSAGADRLRREGLRSRRSPLRRND